ncbi:MAG: amidohydrolase family protein, partial [Longimicrobiales bacterium]
MNVRSNGHITVALTALVLAGCDGSPLLDPAADVVLHGVRVWDGTGAPTTEPSLVQLSQGRVLAITPQPDGVDVAAEATSSGATVVDLTGRFVIPGLINTHGHVGGTWTEGIDATYTDYMTSELERYARFGVTTVNSLGGDGAASVALRDGSWGDVAPTRARLLVAGQVVVGETPEAATQMVDANQAMGVDWMKIRVDDNLGATLKMTPEIYAAVIDRTHSFNIP